ncbi:MAG: hypothetical protein ACKO4X_14345, partial [Alphaproteobacteria bacterium]
MSDAPDIRPILALLEDANDAGRCMEAAAALRVLSQLRPENLQVKAALTRALFGAGLWQEAWDAYEVRFDLMPEVFTKVTRPGPNGPEAMPIWRGGALPDALLVMGEQGLGDTIQFARYALLAAAAGAKVAFSVQDPLLRLFKDFASDVTVIGQNEEPTEFDLHCPLLSLPLAHSTRLATIPAFEQGYLAAPTEDVARWDQRLPKGRRRIGLVWSGSQTHANDANRSVPLAKLVPLFQPGEVWVSLQKEVR